MPRTGPTGGNRIPYRRPEVAIRLAEVDTTTDRASEQDRMAPEIPEYSLDQGHSALVAYLRNHHID